MYIFFIRGTFDDDVVAENLLPGMVHFQWKWNWKGCGRWTGYCRRSSTLFFLEGLRKTIVNMNHSRQSLARDLKRGPCEIRGNSAKYPGAVCKEIADELSKCVMLAKHLCKCRNIRKEFYMCQRKNEYGFCPLSTPTSPQTEAPHTHQ